MNHPHSSIFQKKLLPIWLGFFGIVALPFLSIYRVGPQSAFFLEIASLFWIALWVLLSAFLLRHRFHEHFFSHPNYTHRTPLRLLPAATWFLLTAALYWILQARFLNVDYPGMSDMIAGAFFLYALLACVCRAWLREHHQEQIVAILCTLLLISALIQAIIGWLQYTQIAQHFSGILLYRSGIVEGQLGQRNHFAHYLMWGVLAASLLYSQKRIASQWFVLSIIFLGSSMALTGSRTIFAYLLGIISLSSLWFIIGNRQAKKIALCFFTGTMIVFFMMFITEPLLSLFGNGELNGAAERLSTHKFEQSGRDYEWRKAWQLFLAAPLWGHGWGSYPLQGFLLNIYPSGFRPYEGNVLFTHSHNSLLQILAEMGLTGFLLTFGGLLLIVLSCLKKRIIQNAPAVLFLLSAITVSFIHSIFEYPLWYLYFLSVFILFIALLNPQGEQNSSIRNSPKWASLANSVLPYALMLSATIGMTIMLSLIFSYQQLRQFNQKNTDESKQQKLYEFSQNQHFLRYYSELVLTRQIDPNAANLPDWALPVAKRSNHYRPFANAHKWALIAYRLGHKEEAAIWMEQMYRYYPPKISNMYGKAIMDSPYFRDLQTQYSQICHEYHRLSGQEPQCKNSIYSPSP